MVAGYFFSVDFSSEEVAAVVVGFDIIGAGGAGRSLIWRGPLPWASALTV